MTTPSHEQGAGLGPLLARLTDAAAIFEALGREPEFKAEREHAKDLREILALVAALSSSTVQGVGGE